VKLRLPAGRLVAVGAVAAVGAATLVGLTVPTANAAATPAEYSCSHPYGPAIPVLVQPTGSLPALTAGQAVAAGAAMPVTFNFTRPTREALATNGISQVGISTTAFGLKLGRTAIGLTGLSVPMAAPPATGDFALAAPGKSAAFKAPAAGNYDLQLPTSFVATIATNLIGLPATCVIVDPAAAGLGSVTVAPGDGTDPEPQASSVSATAPKKVKQGGAVPITVVVTTEAPATGTVTATEGGKTLATAPLANGKAKLVVKKLKPGTHTIVVSYSGDDATNASSSLPIKVTVAKKR